MKRFLKKYVCKAVLAGLVISLLPVSVSVQAAQRPFTKEAIATDKPRLTREDIEWHLKQIRNTSNTFSNISNRFKKGMNKTKKAIDEVIAKLTGKSDKISDESKEVLESAAVTSTAVTAGTAGLAGAAGIAGVVGGVSLSREYALAMKLAGTNASKKTLSIIKETNEKIIRSDKLRETFLNELMKPLKGHSIPEVIDIYGVWRKQKDVGFGIILDKETYAALVNKFGGIDKGGVIKVDDFIELAKYNAYKKSGVIPDSTARNLANLQKRAAIKSVKETYVLKNLMRSPTLAAISIIFGFPVFMLPFFLISLGVNAAFFGTVVALIHGGRLALTTIAVNRLEDEEFNYPGTLTTADLETIKIFKNVLKGPIVRALLQGKRIKDARYKIAQNVAKENKLFIRKAASEKRAIKDIQNYMLAKMRIPGLGKVLYPMNLNITWHNYLKYMDIKVTWKVINEYKRMKKDLNQDERNQLMKEQIQYMKGLYDKMSKTKRFLKRLTPGFHVLNVKEFALKIKPSYALNQNALNSDMKTVKKLDAKYGSSFANKVQPAIEKYQQEMQKIIEELSVEVAEVEPQAQ